MIQFLEELSMNAWPALQNMLYDGWLLRFSNGYTKRANSINPVYSSSKDVYDKIAVCEKYYRGQGLDVVYKMTDAVSPNNLDEILEGFNYRIDSETSVQTLDLKDSKQTGLQSILVSNELTEEWLSSFIRLSKVSDKNINSLRNMLGLIVPETYFALLEAEENIIACGLGVLQHGVIGIFDIVVDEAYRNKGYGKKLVSGLLDIGVKNGAEKAYLQVMLNNPPALRLYSNLGFKQVYAYWYRVKDFRNIV